MSEIEKESKIQERKKFEEEESLPESKSQKGAIRKQDLEQKSTEVEPLTGQEEKVTTKTLLFPLIASAQTKIKQVFLIKEIQEIKSLKGKITALSFPRLGTLTWRRKRLNKNIPEISAIKSFTQGIAFPKITLKKFHLKELDATEKPLSREEPKRPALPFPKIEVGVKALPLEKFITPSYEEQTTFLQFTEPSPEPKISEDTTSSLGTGTELDILDLLFEIEEERKDHFLGVDPETPVIILAKKENEDYIEALQLICRELYRIRIGGYPKANETLVDLEKAKNGLTGEKRIATIHGDQFRDLFNIIAEHLPEEGKFTNEQKKIFQERLGELYSQGFGYLIFYLEDEEFNNLFKFLDIKTPSGAYLVPLKLKTENIKAVEKIASLVWGGVRPKDSISVDLGGYFNNYERDFRNRLKRIVMKQEIQRIVKESQEDEEGGKESFPHYAIKAFIVDINKGKEGIKTEEPINGGDKNSPIADVIIPPNEAYEVMTLYGTGFLSLRKIAEKAEDYKKAEKLDNLNLVIPNLQALLFLKELKGLKRDLEQQFNSKLNFWTLNLEKRKLMPLSDLSNKLREELCHGE